MNEVLEFNESVARAMKIASEAHKGQVRKGNGEPYFNHPYRISMKFQKTGERIVALLHDTLEDTELSYDFIRNQFGHDIANTIALLTRKPNQNYYDFIQTIINVGNLVAIEVKIEDIKDNLSDLSEGSLKDKYRFALEKLEKYRQYLIDNQD